MVELLSYLLGPGFGHGPLFVQLSGSVADFGQLCGRPFPLGPLGIQICGGQLELLGDFLRLGPSGGGLGFGQHDGGMSGKRLGDVAIKLLGIVRRGRSSTGKVEGPTLTVGYCGKGARRQRPLVITLHCFG